VFLEKKKPRDAPTARRCIARREKRGTGAGMRSEDVA